MFHSLVVVTTISLLSSITAQVYVPSGYNNPSYGYQVSQTYMPMNYPAQYFSYPRNSLASEYQRYQDLNKLVQQQITGIMQHDPNQLQSVDTTLGASSYRHWHPLRPHYVRPYFSGGKIYSVTPHGLRGLNVHRYGSHTGHYLRSANQEESYGQPMQDVVRNPSARSIQSNDTNSGIHSTLTSHAPNGDDVATNTTVTSTDLPKVESLNESEDKQMDSRSTLTDNLLGSPIQPYQIQLANDQNQPIASVNFNQVQSDTPMESPSSPGSSPEQIFDQIRPDFSHMELYNKERGVANENGKMQEETMRETEGDRSAHNHKGTPPAHPSYSELTPPSGNWLTDTYRNYMNKARSFIQPGYGYPGHQAYVPHSPYSNYPVAPMVQPAAPMYPGQMPHYGGYNPYSAPGGTATSSSTASASSNYNNPYGYRAVMDFVGKGLTYQPSDWARYGQNWATQGVNTLGSYLNNNAMRSHPQGHSALYY